ncbi:MAG: TadE/TadG family type IV pilus assembly protein, partial [Acidimicrobiales bacterium]
MIRIRRRRGADRGATMLEFALVVPFLALMAFGTAEMGLAWTAHNKIEGATSTAARVGASSGGVAEADVNILEALRTALPSESLANLDRVVIFNATDVDGGFDPSCIKPVGSGNQAGISNVCNTYSGATVRSFDETAGDPLGTADNFWQGSTRR